jgi:hypothetical protein
MSVDIQAIRERIAINLATISGLRTEENVPDVVNPPVAVVALEQIAYDGAFQQGLTTLEFNIFVVVSRASERMAQRKLNQFVAPTGTFSIKSAVESDRRLNNLVADLRVRSVTNIGSLQLDDQEYMAAEFAVVVYV